MSEKCRLCLKQDGNFLKIFNNNVDKDIHFNIMNCIGILVKQNDGITDSICPQCFYLVKAFSELRSAAIKNDMRLKEELAAPTPIAQIKGETRSPVQSETKPAESPEKIVPPSPIQEKEKEIPKVVIINPVKIKDVQSPTAPVVQPPIVPVQPPTVPVVQSPMAPVVQPAIVPAVPPSITPPVQQRETQDKFMSHLELTKKDPVIQIPKGTKKGRGAPKNHLSIKKIRILYPNLRLPRNLLKLNLDPKVIVNNRIVTDWLKNKSKNNRSVPSSGNKWTVSACDSNTLNLSIARVPDNLNNLLLDFENELHAEELTDRRSSTKSDSTYYASDTIYNTDSDDDISENSNPNRQRKGGFGNPRKRSKKTRTYSGKRRKDDPRKSSVSDTDSTKNAQMMPPQEAPPKAPEKAPENKEIPNRNKESIPEIVTKIASFLPSPKPGPRASETKSTPEKPGAGEILDLLVAGGADKTYICQTCSLVFDTQKDLRDHKKQHPKDNLRCQSCSKSFPLVEDLIRHNITVHSNQSGAAAAQSSQPKKIAKKSTSKPTKTTTFLRASLESPTGSIKSTSKPTTILRANLEALVDSRQESTENKEKETVTEKAPPVVKPVAAAPSLPVIDNAITLSDDESPKVKSEVIPDQKKGPVSSLSLSDEEKYLKTVIMKCKTKKSDQTAIEAKKSNNPNRNVVLLRVDKLLEKTYIPVEFVPQFDNSNMTLKYVMAKVKPKPKSVSYSWSSKDAVTVPDVGVPPSGVLPLGVPPSGVLPLGAPPSGVLPLGVPPSGVLPLGVPPSGVLPSGVSGGVVESSRIEVAKKPPTLEDLLDGSGLWGTMSAPSAPTPQVNTSCAATSNQAPPSYPNFSSAASHSYANQTVSVQNVPPVGAPSQVVNRPTPQVNTSSAATTSNQMVAPTLWVPPVGDPNQIVKRTTSAIPGYVIKSSNVANTSMTTPVPSSVPQHVISSSLNPFSALTAPKSNTNLMTVGGPQVVSHLESGFIRNIQKQYQDAVKAHSVIQTNSNGPPIQKFTQFKTMQITNGQSGPDVNVQNFIFHLPTTEGPKPPQTTQKVAAPVTKPTIRLKNLSELMATSPQTTNNTNQYQMHQTNSSYQMQQEQQYNHAVAQYFNMQQPQTRPNTSDEYLQI